MSSNLGICASLFGMSTTVPEPRHYSKLWPDSPPSAMTGEEFDVALRNLGFTQVSFSRFLGVAPRSVRRYVQEDPPLYIVRVVELLLKTTPAEHQKYEPMFLRD